METNFCKYCGEKIPYDAVICNKCGRQIEELKSNSKDSIIVNNNVSTNATAIASSSTRYNRCPKNKWILLALCIFTVCGHKFYEEKIGIGILYLFTGGIFGIGYIIDIITLLFKPNPYYV